MLTGQELRQNGIDEYNKIKTLLPMDFEEAARRADLASEACIRQMSRGTTGVFGDTMYPILFKVIFERLIK